MNDAQRRAVEMILGTLPSFQAYQQVGGSEVIVLDPIEPLSVITVDIDGATAEFPDADGEWSTGWSA